MTSPGVYVYGGGEQLPPPAQGPVTAIPNTGPGYTPWEYQGTAASLVANETRRAESAEAALQAEIAALQAPPTIAGVVNAATYGVVGDGVTDNAIMLQNAVNAAAAANEELFIPPGVYITNTDIATPQQATGFVRIRGAGQSATIIRAGSSYSGGTNPVLNLRMSGEVTDLTVDGNSVVITAGGAEFSLTEDIPWMAFRRCTFTGVNPAAPTNGWNLIVWNANANITTLILEDVTVSGPSATNFDAMAINSFTTCYVSRMNLLGLARSPNFYQGGTLLIDGLYSDGCPGYDSLVIDAGVNRAIVGGLVVEPAATHTECGPVLINCPQLQASNWYTGVTGTIPNVQAPVVLLGAPGIGAGTGNSYLFENCLLNGQVAFNYSGLTLQLVNVNMTGYNWLPGIYDTSAAASTNTVSWHGGSYNGTSLKQGWLGSENGTTWNGSIRDVTVSSAAATPVTNITFAPGSIIKDCPGYTLGASGMTQVASTGTAGYVLVNGTGTILSWTAPNDGQPHAVTLGGTVYISSNMTGGELAVSATDPGGNAFALQANPAGVGAGESAIGLAQAWPAVLTIAPGSTISLTQYTALTAGAATVYAEMWADVGGSAGLALDTITADVQPTGSAANAGNSGMAADARHVHPSVQSVTVTSSQTVTAPAWATVMDLLIVGGHGGGGCGAVATATEYAVGGGGGGSGAALDLRNLPVTGGESLAISIGAGGAGQPGATVSPGWNAQPGGATSVTVGGTTYSAAGGQGGQNGATNGQIGGGQPGLTSVSTSLQQGGSQPGWGGWANGYRGEAGGAPSGGMAGGGSAGSPVMPGATLGGWGGLAGTIYSQGLENYGQTATLDGAAGTSGATDGTGGGGGGGGAAAPGGTSGAGGNGGSGTVYIVFRAS